LLAVVTQITSIIVARSTTGNEATDAIATNIDTIVTIKAIDTSRNSPTKRRMTAYAITSRTRTRSCTMITLFFECGHFVRKNESLPFKVSFSLTLPFLLSLKQ
jgi:hypothetical protein